MPPIAYIAIFWQRLSRFFAESLCFFMRIAMGFLIFAWQVVILDLMCIKSQISCEKHKKPPVPPCTGGGTTEGNAGDGEIIE